MSVDPLNVPLATLATTRTMPLLTFALAVLRAPTAAPQGLLCAPPAAMVNTVLSEQLCARTALKAGFLPPIILNALSVQPARKPMPMASSATPVLMAHSPALARSAAHLAQPVHTPTHQLVINANRVLQEHLRLLLAAPALCVARVIIHLLHNHLFALPAQPARILPLLVPQVF
jgi:hypothetical protein